MTPHSFHFAARRGVQAPTSFRLAAAALAVAAVFTGACATAHAQPQAQAAARDYRIPAGTLDSVLAQFGAQADVLIAINPALTQGKSSQGLSGSHSVSGGLARILQASGLEAVAEDGGSAYQLRRAPAEPGVPTLSPVTVTGMRDNWTPPPPAPGGQVATGGRVGILGNRDVMDTPFSTMNYTAALIENQQARSIGDVLANDPSVVSGWPRDSYIDQPHVRGFNILGEDITYGGLYGVAPPTKMPVETVERVEVLKGTSAFLRGISPGGSIGASINLVPKRAEDDPLTRFTATYDSRSQFGGHVDIGRRFGESDQFGIRVNGVYRNGEGAVRDNNNTMGNATVGLDYRSERVRLSADLGYDRLKIERGAWWYFVDTGSFSIPKPPGKDVNPTQKWNYANSKTQYGMLRGEVDIASNVTAYAAVGGQHSQRDILSPEPVISNSQGDFLEYFSYRPAETRSTTGEAGVRVTFSTAAIQHEVTVGATGLWQKNYAAREYNGEGASNLYNPIYYPKPDFTTDLDNQPMTSRSNLSSVVLADTMSMLDGRLLIMGGIRHQRVDVTDYTNGVGNSYDKSATTPGVGVVVKPWRNVSVYGNYMEALNKGPTAPDFALNAGQVFAPYKSKQYEAGVKVDLDTWMATVSAFQATRPNAQYDPATRLYSLNGEQRNRGLEFSVMGEPVRGVRVLGGAMLLDAVLTSTPDGKNDGDNAAGAPKWVYRAGVEWDPAFVPSLTLTARVNHASSQYVNTGNTQKIPAWTTLDLGARYVLSMPNAKPVTLRLGVDNVFDKRYWASAAGVSGGWLNMGSPRSVSLSAQFDF